MSIALYVCARSLTLRAPLKAVLKELCFIADDAGGSIFPSVSTLAAYSGLCERAVRNALDELESLGYITRPERDERRGGDPRQTVQYRVNVKALATPAQDAPLPPVHPCTTCTPTPAPHSPTPAPHSVTPAPRAANRPYKPERPGKDKGPRAKRASVEYTPPSWISAELWDDYEEMRRKIRKPMTDKARQLAVRDLGKLRDAGHSPQAVLEQSIANSWSGVFPLKDNRNGRSKAEQQQARNLAALDTAFPVDR